MKPISLKGLSEYRRAVTNQDKRQHNILFFVVIFILYSF